MKLTLNEFNKLKNNLLRTRNSPVHKDNGKDGEIEAVYHKANEALFHIKSLVPGVLFTKFVRLEVEFFGNKSADVDNVLKAIADGLQGVGYKNDKQIKDSRSKSYD